MEVKNNTSEKDKELHEEYDRLLAELKRSNSEISELEASR